MVNSAKEAEELAGTVPDNGGVYFVPAFAGMHPIYEFIIIAFKE